MLYIKLYKAKKSCHKLFSKLEVNIAALQPSLYSNHAKNFKQSFEKNKKKTKQDLKAWL